MTEQDLELKSIIRRLWWRMGFSTKVDVPLRALVPSIRGQSRDGHETYTDLDVLGVWIGADGRIQFSIADCKTSPRGSTERMFWIRGVAELFDTSDAYMIRSVGPTAAARQLAAKLRVGVLTPAELATLEDYYPTPVDLSRDEISFLFNPVAIAGYRDAMTKIDKRLKPLRDYQECDFWVYEEHRNLFQMVAHLADSTKYLNPSNPAHRALFYDSLWLYSLSVLRAAEHVRRTHLADIDTTLREYVFGGQLGLREKRRLATVLRDSTNRKPTSPDHDVFPPYFSALLDLVTRFVRRPTVATGVLRYAEWASELSLSKIDSPAAHVFGTRYNELAGKLLTDVAGFLCGAARLDAGFRAEARRLFELGNKPLSKVQQRSICKDDNPGNEVVTQSSIFDLKGDGLGETVTTFDVTGQDSSKA